MMNNLLMESDYGGGKESVKMRISLPRIIITSNDDPLPMEDHFLDHQTPTGGHTLTTKF